MRAVCRTVGSLVHDNERSSPGGLLKACMAFPRQRSHCVCPQVEGVSDIRHLSTRPPDKTLKGRGGNRQAGSCCHPGQNGKGQHALDAFVPVCACKGKTTVQWIVMLAFTPMFSCCGNGSCGNIASCDWPQGRKNAASNGIHQRTLLVAFHGVLPNLEAHKPMPTASR